VLALVGLDVFVASPAKAATFTVTKTADTADGTCDADCSLREAVIAANALSDADTITLPAGHYVLTIAGENEDAAATGDLDITSPLTINGAGSATTTVDGDDSVANNESDRVFDVFGRELIVALSGMTIQGGEQTGSNNVEDDGGGIRVANVVLGSENTLNLRNSVVRDNHVGTGSEDSASGGGIFLSGDDDTLNLDNTKVGTYLFPNTATRGAGIKGNGTGNVITAINNSEIAFNEADSGGGGIFLLGSDHSVSLNNSDLLNNFAGGDGGGLYLHAGASSSTVSIVNGSRVNENTAGSRGGGLRAIGAAALTLSVVDSEILGNNASSGGGMYLEGNDQQLATVDASRIAFNRALGECESGNGGGILNTSSAPTIEGPSYSLRVLNGSSVDRNAAGCEGGGVQLEGVGSMLLDESSVDHNVAGGSGGGIYGAAGTVFSIEDGAVDLNSSLENGGGIYNDGTGNIVGGSEVVGNSAPHGNGGGIYNGGDVNEAELTVGSSEVEGLDPVIVGNTADSGGGIFNTSGSNVTIDGAFIAGNSGVADDGTGSGGGIDNSGTLSMTATVVAFNTAGSDGGGIANHGNGNSDQVESSLVFGNNASNRGGGIFNEGQLRMSCTAVAGNTSGDGGGLYTASQGHPTGCATQGSFRRRLSKRALVRDARQETRFAAKVMQQQGEEVVPPDVIIDGIGDFMGDAIFAGNSASGDGGGAYNAGSSSFRDVTFDGNNALGRGGGLFQATDAAHLNVIRTTFADNFADQAGGGVFNESDNSNGFVYVRNSTVSGNFTNGTGGGIRDAAATGLDLDHVTVTNNSAPEGNGGGVDADGEVSAASTIVARNMGGDCQSQLDSEGFNLDSDGTCFATGGTDITNPDPQLGPLENNGGQTDTHLPESDSPVVDAAEDGSTPPCMAGGDVAFTDDQRGFVRPVNERCDIGSVELQENELPEGEGPPPDTFQTFAATGPGIYVTTTEDAVVNPEDGECTLREAVITANTNTNHDVACTPVDEDFDRIVVPAGFYELEIPVTGEELSATGDLDITDDTTVVGDGVEETIVDGDQIDRVFDVNPAATKPAPVVEFRDMTIQNGAEENGAGIRSQDDLTLVDTDVVYNRAECFGGGIYSDSPLILDGTFVDKNSAGGGECNPAGGGIYSIAPAQVLNGSTVYLNNTPEIGGGIYNAGTGTPGLEVVDSSVSGNVLTAVESSEIAGAGIYNETSAGIEGSDIVGNVTFAGEGAGIYNGGTENVSTLDVFESTIGLNVAGGPGGGIYADGSSEIISEVTAFAGNVSSGGGGIYNEGDLVSTDDLFLFNVAAGGGSGGGLWNSTSGAADLVGGGFLFNIAMNASGGSGAPKVRAQEVNDFTGGGGGIQNDANGDPEVEEGEENAGLIADEMFMVGNVATTGSGGGLNNRGVAYITDSDLFANVSAGSGRGSVGGGGAINCHILYLEDSIVEDNVAVGVGGGLFNQEICQINQTLHLEYSTVAGNVAVESGGGAQNSVGTIDAFNSTISGNFAAFGAGGGLKDESFTTIHLDSVTVAFNSSSPETGGGVHEGEVDALNTIVGHNYGQDCNNTLTSNGHNIDSDGTCFAGLNDELHPGRLLDLKLGPLAFNAGTTLTHALLTGSPAIDQTPDGPACPSDDQRHILRPQGSMCDIGAYEGQQSPGPGPGGPGPGPSPSSGQVDLSVIKTASPEPVTSGGTLTYTITVKNLGTGAASGVVVTDQLPAQVGFVSSSSTQGSCSGETTVTCQIGNMTDGQEVVVTIVVTAGSPGTITNTAVVSAQSNDPTSSNNSSTATSTVVSGGGGEPGETERSVTINDGHTSTAARVDVDKRRRNRRKLVLHGAVIAPNQEECSSRVPVEVHKKGKKKGPNAGQWVTKASGLTRANGTYRFVLKHKVGRYRAFAPEVVLENEHVCKAAVSRTLRHRHQRR
jgi:uncharacterized repeat protein (TIGR01451 family)/CSLREA domain-containing protein